MKQEIKFVYFDLGSIFCIWKIAVEKFDAKYGKLPGEFRKLYDKHDADGNRGTIKKGEYWKLYTKFLGLDEKLHTHLADEFVGHFTPITSMHNFAAEVLKHYPIGILSNINAETWERVYEKNLIPHLNFSAVILSFETGFIKPEKEIYQLATQRAGVKKEEIFFIDDSLPNIQAAKEFGWKTYHFNENEPEKGIVEMRNLLHL